MELALELEALRKLSWASASSSTKSTPCISAERKKSVLEVCISYSTFSKVLEIFIGSEYIVLFRFFLSFYRNMNLMTTKRIIKGFNLTEKRPYSAAFRLTSSKHRVFFYVCRMLFSDRYTPDICIRNPKRM